MKNVEEYFSLIKTYKLELKDLSKNSLIEIDSKTGEKKQKNVFVKL